MSNLYSELQSARVEMALAIGEMQSIHDLANGRLNRCLRLIACLEDAAGGKGGSAGRRRPVTQRKKFRRMLKEQKRKERANA